MTTSTYEPASRPAMPYNRGRRATDRPGRRAGRDPERLARGLGWFSIGLGVAEVAATRALIRMIGVNETRENCNVMRAMGLREIAAGVGILAQPDSAGRVWVRVGGDAIDLALLGSALTSDESDRSRVTTATLAVAGVTLLDVLAGRKLSAEPDRTEAGVSPRRGIHVTRTTTVNRPPNEVYRFWRDFQNLPRFMAHLESVQVLDERRSHWKAKAPAGASIEWDAEIVEDRPGELIAWRSLEGARVPNSGSVRLMPAPGGRGTEIRVELRYDPPGGAIGAAIAKLFGKEPGQEVDADLRRFKQVMEVGEVVHSDASIHSGMHPARPPEEPFREDVVAARGGMES